MRPQTCMSDVASETTLNITSLAPACSSDWCQNNNLCGILCAEAESFFFFCKSLRQHCLSFSLCSGFLPHRKQQRHHLLTHSGLQEHLPLKWLSLLPVEVKGQAKPPLLSVAGLLSPGNKKEEDDETLDMIWLKFVAAVGSKTQPQLWSPHPLVSETPNLWIQCLLSPHCRGK